MCFRPTELSMNECPQCGAKNKPIATECAQCGAPLTVKKIDFDADQAKLDAFATMPPMAPGMPKAPGTPKPPAPPSV